MASTSQRRDLDDPAVIRNFARRVETPEMVSLLTLHTFVDSQATSDKLWNGFKDSLLWLLHVKSMRLMGGGTEFTRAEDKQRELLTDEVRRTAPADLSEEELLAHFTGCRRVTSRSTPPSRSCTTLRWRTALCACRFPTTTPLWPRSSIGRTIPTAPATR